MFETFYSSLTRSIIAIKPLVVIINKLQNSRVLNKFFALENLNERLSFVVILERW